MNIIDIVREIEIVQKGILRQEVEKAWNKYPIGSVITRKDGRKYKKVSETGNSNKDWQLVTGDKNQREEAKEERIKNGKQGSTEVNTKELPEQAKNTSETALQNAIRQSPNPEVRQAAHEELQRRESEEVPQKGEKSEGEEVEHKLVDFKIKLNEEFLKVGKELMDFTDYSNNDALKKLQGRQREISRFVQFVKKTGKSNELDKNVELLKNKLNHSGDIKDLFGDGEVLSLDIKEDSGNIKSTVIFEDGITERIFNVEDKSVEMKHFYLNPFKEKGKGLGSNIFKNQVEQFKKLGFEKLKTEAGEGNGLNGYYTWARLGYDFDEPWAIKTFKSMLKIENNKKLKNIKSLPQLMSVKEGREWWRENGFAFNGVFDLSDDSVSMEILNEYNK